MRSLIGWIRDGLNQKKSDPIWNTTMSFDWDMVLLGEYSSTWIKIGFIIHTIVSIHTVINQKIQISSGNRNTHNRVSLKRRVYIKIFSQTGEWDTYNVDSVIGSITLLIFKLRCNFGTIVYVNHITKSHTELSALGVIAVINSAVWYCCAGWTHRPFWGDRKRWGDHTHLLYSEEWSLGNSFRQSSVFLVLWFSLDSVLWLTLVLIPCKIQDFTSLLSLFL